MSSPAHSNNIDLNALKLTPGISGQITGSVSVGGVPFRIELIRINSRTGNVAMHASRTLQNRIDAVRSFDRGHSYQSVRYNGREYFMLIYPCQSQPPHK